MSTIEATVVEVKEDEVEGEQVAPEAEAFVTKVSKVMSQATSALVGAVVASARWIRRHISVILISLAVLVGFVLLSMLSMYVSLVLLAISPWFYAAYLLLLVGAFVYFSVRTVENIREADGHLVFVNETIKL